MITIVNIKRGDPYDIYIGRSSQYKHHIYRCRRCSSRPLNLCRIGLSLLLLGNPYELGRDGNRKEVLTLFRGYAEYRFDTDPDFRQMVTALDGKIAGCFCHPLSCHGDVYNELVQRVVSQ